MTALLTFIIPAFNAERTIDDAVHSVLAQSHREIEVIVVDDGSTDATFMRASAISDPRLKVVRRTNRGVARSRNLGLVLARGEFICFLDADDALLPQFATTALGAIGKGDGISAAYRDTDPLLKPSPNAWYPSLSDLRLDRLRTGNPLSIGATVFRTDTLHQVEREFGEVFPVDNQVEDWELLLRFTSLGGRWAAPVEQPLMLCRLLPGSRSAQAERVWKDGAALIERWVPGTERFAARRNWTLVQLARALANEQSELAATMLKTTGSLTDSDVPTLVGALRVWAARHLTGTGGSISFDDLTRRIGTIGASLASQVASDALAPAWSDLALHAAKLLAPHERLVVYGFGKNGREASRALSFAGVAHSVIDDDPGFQHPSRTTVADLCLSDVVLITPDRRTEILARLRATRVSRVLTLESLRHSTRDAA
jgi:hypothetical protein